MEFLNVFDGFNPMEYIDWVNFMFFIFGLLTNPEKLAQLIVDAIKRLIPKPFKKPILTFINQISKGFDKAIPDEIKEEKKVEKPG